MAIADETYFAAGIVIERRAECGKTWMEIQTVAANTTRCEDADWRGSQAPRVAFGL
jgi:hypothetical protein